MYSKTPNPYEVTVADAHGKPAGDFSEDIGDRFLDCGFRFLGTEIVERVETTIWWKRFSWLPIPTVCRFFVKQLDHGLTPTLDTLVEFDRQSLQRTNAEEFGPPWARLQIPMTVTAVISASGFAEDVIGFVTTTKLPGQAGQPHGLFLVDLSTRSLHFLKNSGGSVNFKNAHKAARRIFAWVNDKDE